MLIGCFMERGCFCFSGKSWRNVAPIPSPLTRPRDSKKETESLSQTVGGKEEIELNGLHQQTGYESNELQGGRHKLCLHTHKTRKYWRK